MSSFARRAAAVAALLVLAGCTDRQSPLEPRGIPPGRPPDAGSGGVPEAVSPVEARHERLARRFALAMRDTNFRATVFRTLRQSRYREGKVYLQRFLGNGLGRHRRRLAELAEEAEATIAADLDAAAPIEIYLPVPAHRRTWHGDANVLVATAEGDHDPPVAFDPTGRRQLLDPDQPPGVPVIALGRSEVNFDAAPGPSGAVVYDEDPDGGTTSGWTPTTPHLTSPGLYMTYAKFNSTFEGWLKGAPEFEVHILGQDGNSNVLKDYQCAGEQAGGPYSFNMDNTEWNGQVMLFSQAQLDAYKAQHPGQALRILIIEDDDTPCLIKTDSARVSRMFQLIAANYGMLTGGKDTLISMKTYKKAKTLLEILASIWSVFKTQDDIVGTAIEDSVAGEYFFGANWIVKGENNITQGAIRLEMR